MKKVVERYVFTRDAVDKTEEQLSHLRQIERYCMIRQWCRGKVLDFGCGSGYGTYIVSKNSDVKSILGYDISTEAIDWAEENFSNYNLQYTSKLENTSFDMLLAIEVVEHILDKTLIPTIAKNLEVKEVILSYPSKKTTHYNKFHYYDYNTQELLDLFIGYKLLREINFHEECKILMLIKDTITS